MEKDEEQVKPVERCGICLNPVKISIFKGSGYCCENHRKMLDGEDPVGLARYIRESINDSDGGINSGWASRVESSLLERNKHNDTSPV